MMRLRILLTSLSLLTGAPAFAASVDKSIEIKAPAEKVWSMIGNFCSIKEWHPAIGECTEKDGTRTLTTKDGKGQFVEKEVDRDDKKMTYAYEIEKSPLPVKSYHSTIKVTPKGKDDATVEWSSTFVPEDGKEQDAQNAIASIYQAGLDSIQTMAAK